MAAIEAPVRTIVQGPLGTCRPLASLRGVAGVLADNLVGALVVGFPEDVIGIVSERDLVRAMAEGMDPDEDRIRDVMSEPVETIEAGASITEAARLMLADEIRHLVVVEGSVAIGIVSMRDVLAALMAAEPGRQPATA